MSNEGYINATELRKAITQLHPNGELFEVRIIGQSKPISGYFKDAETLLKALTANNLNLKGTNVYITLNPLNDALYSRQQADRFISSKTTTSDKEVDGYDWLFIDFDPVRPTGISSTNEELKKSMDVAQKVYVYLKSEGFEEPIKAFSGNGYHLLYKISLQNTPERTKLIERCLKALSVMFSTDDVKVDTTNSNPSRICKLYGTLAQKGRNSEDRPHRMARIDGEIKDLKITPLAYLEKLAAEVEEETIRPATYNSYAPAEFDIVDWMNSHGLQYTVKAGDGYTKYILDECPFDSNHKAPDSMIIRQHSGAIGFKCLHNSCSDKKWQDVRKLFEPDAYEKSELEFERIIEEGIRRHNRDRKKKEINVNNGNIWESVSDVLNKPTPDNEYVKTQIKEIDKLTHGLLKGGVSIWSGLRGSAKSTVLSQIGLQAVNDNHNVLVYSGELTDKRFVRWLLQQAAGKQYSREIIKEDSSYWFVPKEIETEIAAWISDRLYIYNNSYGSNYQTLIKQICEKTEKVKPDLVIIDNLMTVDIQGIDSNEYRAQTGFMLELTNLAKQFNCHVALVAHPRKAATFLRLNDVSGSGNLVNLVDSAFIVHRVNHDFKKAYIAEFCKPNTKEDDVPLFRGTNVIEIAKDREEGIQDKFIPLWYERESRRLLNSPTEVLKFKWLSSWADTEKEQPFMDDESTPFT